MNEQSDTRTLQLFYAGLMVDAAANFERFGAIFGCARWELGELDGGAVVAETRTCLACAIAKKQGGGRPCELYCINPFRGLAGAMSPSRDLEVEETLWEGGRCRFRLF
jgi:hypothetical protein